MWCTDADFSFYLGHWQEESGDHFCKADNCSQGGSTKNKAKIYQPMKKHSKKIQRKKLKLFRITTVDISLAKLLTGQMRYLASMGFQVTMFSAETQFREQVMETEGCPHIVIPMKRQISLLDDIKCLLILIKKFRELRPDIVHTHTSKAGLLGMLAAKIIGIPIRIQTVAGTPPDAENSKIKKIIMFTTERITFWAASHVWPNSYSLLEYIKTNKFTKSDKLEVVGRGSSNGIDLKKYSSSALAKNKTRAIKEKIKYDDKNFYFLFVGRLISDKGIVELIEAFENIIRKNSDIVLLLVGELESHRSQVPKNIVDIIKQHPQIIHIGWSNEVEYYIDIANFVIHPSHREGFPNIALQAGALDTPLLVSDVVGNRDCVQHLETGYLFEAKSSSEIQKAVNFAMRNPDVLKTCASNWKKIIIEHYERTKVQTAYYKKYCELLDIDNEK